MDENYGMNDDIVEGVNYRDENTNHPQCHPRDNLAKQEILEPLVHGNYRSRELFNLSKYQGNYKDFTSHLTRYVKKGYVNKLGKRPSTYQLTELGIENCIDNPFGYRKMRIEQCKQWKKNNVEIRYVDSEGGSGNSEYSGNRINSNSDFGDSGDYHGHDREKHELIAKIKELEEKNEELTIDLNHEKNKTAKMVVYNNPPPTPTKEPNTKNERGYDDVLRAYKDKKITGNGYKALPKQIVRITALPKGSVTEDIKRLLFRKKIGNHIVVPKHTVSTLVSYGFAKPLATKQIESLTMKWKNGNVYLVSNGGSEFEIATVPKGNPPQPQRQIRINP